MKCKRSSDGRSIDHHTLQVMRQQAVKAVREGQSPDDVAQTSGVNRRTVFRWLAAYTDGGQTAYGLWTRSLISELIHRQFKTKLGLSTLCRIMKNLGFTVQTPLHWAWQQDPVLVNAWETET